MIKFLPTYRLFVLMFGMISCITIHVKAQSGFVSAGIEITGVSGSISASVGQTFDFFMNGHDALISEGLQQLYPGTFKWQLPITRLQPYKSADFVFPDDLMACHLDCAFGCHSSRHQFLQVLDSY